MIPHDLLNTHRHYRIAGLLISVLILLSAAAAQAQAVSAQLNPLAFSTQQPATLTITVTGERSADLTMPEVEGLAFHRRGQSSQFRMTNGSISSSVTYTYLVQGLEPGHYTIPPIAVSVDGKIQQTAAISCTVSQAGNTNPGNRQVVPGSPATRLDPNDADKFAFIRLIPEKKTAYNGEIVPSTIKAYFLSGIKVNLNSLPTLKGDGVLLNALDNDPLQQEEVINGTTYTVLTWETALTGIKTGNHELSLDLDATMLIPSRQRRQLPGFGNNLFQDDIFDDFFGRYENRPIRVSSPVISLDTRELPGKGRPESFTGAIGNFTLDLKAEPLVIDAGEPLTLTMTVKGRGNFDNVEVPSLSSSAGLKTYTPSSTFHNGAHRYEGNKVFEQAVIVNDPSVNQIPPVAFSYFDPDKEQYLTLFSDPIEVTVKSPATASPPSPPTGPATASAATAISAKGSGAIPDLAPPKIDSGTLVGRIQPLFTRGWFIAATLLCLCAILAVSGYRLRQRRLAKRPEVFYQKQVNRQRQEMLNTLGVAESLDNAHYPTFVQQGLRQFLALLWQVEPGALTTADIHKRLGPESAVTELFSLTDQAAYGALLLTLQQRKHLHERIITAVSELS